VSETDLFTPSCGVLIYEMSFWDTTAEAVARLRETAIMLQARKVWWGIAHPRWIDHALGADILDCTGTGHLGKRKLR
jgi:hypothetical protein